MNPKAAPLAGLLPLCLLACRPEPAPPSLFRIDEVAMRIGDDPAWARPEHDDAAWQRIAFGEVPQVDSILWLRARVGIEPDHLRGRPLGIFFAAMAAHEIWWDGERIGAGGTVGASPDAERPGPIQTHYAVPDRLAAPGPHLLAIRVSAFHRHFRPRTGYWVVLVGDYDRILSIGSSYSRAALVGLSGIVMVAVFALMMFAQDRRDRSFLILGLLCLTAAALLIAESWRNLFGYTYDRHLVRLLIVTGLSWSLEVLLVVFLARRFPMPGARWFLIAGGACATAPIVAFASWDLKSIAGFALVLLASTAWCARAALRRLPGSLLALSGVSLCCGAVLLDPDLFLDRNLYLALDVLLLCLLGSHVMQVGRVRREREAALLKSSRLELELIRKHIQPHFLLNTLNALAEWIDQEPRVAAGMIQSLAEEFRILSDIADRPLIRMEEEIRLCRVHLEIMSRRNGRPYDMTTDGVDESAPIPPAVIHTLVENAITHGRHADGRVDLRLGEERRDGRRRYTFSSPDDARPGAAIAEGTGLRYVRARLQESFGDRWSLACRSEGSRWITEITVPERA
jgi:hypothetical protein